MPTCEDLESFLARYCPDPGSTENLLLILGEPGAGKSLLSKMICGRMITTSNIFLYIPLRDYSMERNIETIVLDQLRMDGDPSEPLPSLKWFQEEFPDAPMTIIFDGYDEILQATGKVHRNLLDEIHNFQTKCLDNRRPVRVIVTSRVTLIDKADIPAGTTVMKLLEFDRPRKEKWMEIWNRYNSGVLAQYRLEPFALDEDNENVIKLSNQPLLLLMLAMYDADFDNRRNALKTAREDGLNRAALYDALLRRFIRRERLKGVRGGEEDSFDAAGRPEELVDEDMRRLGAAALGMLVRGKLSLRSAELLEDLRSLGVPQLYGGEPSRAALNDAEALFGSFFFVHTSHAAGNDREGREAAYEFLHKTFYEFLVADMCLGALIAAADKLDAKRSGRYGERDYQDTLKSPQGEPFSVFYYTVLTGACLCREPEAVRMVREWRDGKLRQRFREDPEQAEGFSGRLGGVVDDILTAHRDIVRRGSLSLSDWGVRGLGHSSDDSQDFGKDNPQAAAVYLLNLVMLQILTSGECVMDTEEWRWLAQYVKLFVPFSPWRTQDIEIGFDVFSKYGPDRYEVIVLQFMSIFQIQCKERNKRSFAIITMRETPMDLEKIGLLDAKESLFWFLRDDITFSLVVLHDERLPSEMRKSNLLFLNMCDGMRENSELIIHEMILILLDFEKRSTDYWTPDRRDFFNKLFIRSMEAIKRVSDLSIAMELLTITSKVVNSIPSSDQYLEWYKLRIEKEKYLFDSRL